MISSISASSGPSSDGSASQIAALQKQLAAAEKQLATLQKSKDSGTQAQVVQARIASIEAQIAALSKPQPSSNQQATTTKVEATDVSQKNTSGSESSLGNNVDVFA